MLCLVPYAGQGMEHASLQFPNVESMEGVFTEALPHVWRGVFLQGSMFDEKLMFQLYWSPSTLEIIQVGVVAQKRRTKLSTKWFEQVMHACHFYRLRVIAKNVLNPLVSEKLFKCGFKQMGEREFVFPF
jgi:hypothetical protein